MDSSAANITWGLLFLLAGITILVLTIRSEKWGVHFRCPKCHKWFAGRAIAKGLKQIDQGGRLSTSTAYISA